MPAHRVLIVDDSLDTARMMKILLKREGYEARTASNGEEAVAIALAFLPEIILLDLNLPILSGQEVAVILRGHEALAGCLIIAISGRDDQDLPPGFDDFFVKPLDHEALIARLAFFAGS